MSQSALLPETSAAVGPNVEWAAHWRTVLAVSIGIATGYTVFQFSASLFIAPWQQQFGWSRGQIALAHNGLLLGALLSPMAGRLLDRHGIRRPILIAMALTGAGYIAMAQLNGSLTQYYLLFLLLQLVGIMTTGLSFTRAIVARFQASRGTALAISRVGLALLGILLPNLVHMVIIDQGWRAAFFLLAGITLLVGVPVCWWGIRDPAPTADAHARPQRQPGFVELIRRHPKILLVCLAGGLHYAPIGAILSQLQPLLMLKDISAGDAAMAGGVFAGSVLIGTLFSGVLADRIWAPLVGCLFAVGPLIGCILLLQDEPSYWRVLLAVGLIGTSQGAEIDVIAYLTARYFGIASFSAIYGLVMMITIICSFSGQVGIGFAYDQFGDYQTALLIGCGMLAAAAASYLAMGRYPATSDGDGK